MVLINGTTQQVFNAISQHVQKWWGNTDNVLRLNIFTMVMKELKKSGKELLLNGFWKKKVKTKQF